MTDAERIAALMNRMDLRESPNWTASQVQRCATADPDSMAATILAMLSDVRREEREACLADIAAEKARWQGDLDSAEERIVSRCTK